MNWRDAVLRPALTARLEQALERHEELEHLLASGHTMRPQELTALSKEHAALHGLVQAHHLHQKAWQSAQEAEALLGDPEYAAMAREDLAHVASVLRDAVGVMEEALVPGDPNDDRDVYLEIRAGTGGDEAALFAGDVLRMYLRYAQKQGWKASVIAAQSAEVGGYKEAIVHVTGHQVYARLKFESGGHRVQRVPVTESQGRIHTSACTVAVMPEGDAVEAITLNPADLKVDTYRASGAGGQHVNKTDSAIRITHLPSGVVVECQEERSQHKNRAKAMALLQARLAQAQREQHEQATAAQRKRLVGSGDRSERIRTYNFPQGRLTDHRIHFTLHSLEAVMEGDLEPVIEALRREHRLEQLDALERS